MNLKNVTDKNLLALAEDNRTLERTTITASLHYLKEIESRRLFSTLGFPSLFDFSVKHLKYSEDEACRRISAMRLLKEIPEIEDKINSGDLSLTNLNQAQSLFRREAKENRSLTKSDKVEFLSKIEGKSKREAEKIVASASPDVHFPDKIRAISQSQILISYTADESLLAKLERLKGMLAHSHPNISLAELTDWLCDIGIAALDKTSPAPARVKNAAPIERPLSKSAIRKAVWKRDNGRCQNCNSDYAVEIDHITPKALGGADSLANLRLLCRKCNQRAAIEVFGRKKMSNFLSCPQTLYRI